MDHFNITVQDGAMVSTRKGFQVSKSRHNGTAFINTSVRGMALVGVESVEKLSLPVCSELTFVNNGGDGRRSRRKTRATCQASARTKAQRSGAQNGVRSSHHRLTPCSRSPSSSPSTSAPDDLVQEDAYSAKTSRHSWNLQRLPTWASYESALDLTDSDLRLKFMAIAYDSEDLDRQETDNAKLLKRDKDPGQSAWLVQEPTSLHCAVTLGALFDAIKSGKRETERLNTLASQLYSIVNRRLSANNRNSGAQNVTMRAVASLAIISGYQEKFDHWYVHMRGLLNLVDLAGGLNNLHPGTRNIVHKADLVGAIPAATKPCISFRCFNIVERQSGTKSVEIQITKDMKRHLQACKVSSEVCNIILLAIELIESTRNKQAEVSHSLSLDTDRFFEDFCHSVYNLIAVPEPFQNFEDVLSSCTSTDISIRTHTYHTPDSISTANDETGPEAIETAVRIVTLLYLKELMLDVPCSNNILLGLLARQVNAILSNWRLDDLEDPFTSLQMREESWTLQRPVLIWICTTGQFFMQHRSNMQHCKINVERDTIYRDCLHVLARETLLNKSPFSDHDLELLRYFDLSQLSHADWDDSRFIKDMLGPVKAG